MFAVGDIRGDCWGRYREDVLWERVVRKAVFVETNADSHATIWRRYVESAHPPRAQMQN
jgi:hypothetical protein